MSTALIKYLDFQPKPAPFSYFDITKKEYYSIDEQNLGLLSLVQNEIEPFLKLLESNEKYRVTLSMTIPILEFLKNSPDIIKRFGKLVNRKQVEILSGQGYNSLSLLYSRALFEKEVDRYNKLVKDLFGASPAGYMNAALLYSDAFGELIAEHGYKYAVAPRVQWFIKDDSTFLYQAREPSLKLVVPMSGKQDSAIPVKVYLANGLGDDFTDTDEEFVLLSSLTGEKDPPEYSLPDLVAQNIDGGGIDLIVGNSLQKDFLKRLTELSQGVVDLGDEKLMADYLWIGSLPHFIALSNKSGDRHKVYTKLLTMLYDMEIRTRS